MGKRSRNNGGDDDDNEERYFQNQNRRVTASAFPSNSSSTTSPASKSNSQLSEDDKIAAIRKEREEKNRVKKEKQKIRREEMGREGSVVSGSEKVTGKKVEVKAVTETKKSPPLPKPSQTKKKNSKSTSPQTALQDPTLPAGFNKPTLPKTKAPKPPPPMKPLGKLGLKYHDKQVGTGPIVNDKQKVHVSYTGRGNTIDGKVFDRSSNFSFKVGKGEVITAWDMGVRGMREGGVRVLFCPKAVGYGEQNIGAGVGADLWFEIHVLDNQAGR